jgi:hypothetical protein
MNGKHDHHDHGKHDHHGKHLNASLGSGAGTVSLTLDVGTAQDLLQALTLALGGGVSKGKLTAIQGGKKPGGGGKGYGGGQPKG